MGFNEFRDRIVLIKRETDFTGEFAYSIRFRCFLLCSALSSVKCVFVRAGERAKLGKAPRTSTSRGAAIQSVIKCRLSTSVKIWMLQRCGACVAGASLRLYLCDCHTKAQQLWKKTVYLGCVLFELKGLDK